MARPVNRKEWLETFLWLADRNRPAREFRLKLGIKLPNLSSAIKSINAFRDELEQLYVSDKTKKSISKKIRPELYIDDDSRLEFSNGPIVPASG